MFNEALLHPQTKKNAETFLRAPSQTLLLLGPKGSGKIALARMIAAFLLGIREAELDAYPYFAIISKEPNKKNIPIESIRQIKKTVQLKVPLKTAVNRIILIRDAQLMNAEAQNAFLKTLEEPAAGTVFLLTADSTTNLLPTLISRTLTLKVHTVSLETALSFYGEREKNEVETAWRLSQGAAGLMKTLLYEEDNELRSAVKKAKSLLLKNRYERLLELDKASRNKEEFSELLEGLARVVKALYRISAEKNDKPRTTALLRAMSLILDAQKELDSNVLARLIALKLSLGLPI